MLCCAGSIQHGCAGLTGIHEVARVVDDVLRGMGYQTCRLCDTRANKPLRYRELLRWLRKGKTPDDSRTAQFQHVFGDGVQTHRVVGQQMVAGVCGVHCLSNITPHADGLQVRFSNVLSAHAVGAHHHVYWEVNQSDAGIVDWLMWCGPNVGAACRVKTQPASRVASGCRCCGRAVCRQHHQGAAVSHVGQCMTHVGCLGPDGRQRCEIQLRRPTNIVLQVTA